MSGNINHLIKDIAEEGLTETLAADLHSALFLSEGLNNSEPAEDSYKFLACRKEVFRDIEICSWLMAHSWPTIALPTQHFRIAIARIAVLRAVILSNN